MAEINCIVILLIFKIVVNFVSVIAVNTNETRMVRVFKNNQIIPDVLPHYYNSMGVVYVTYPGNVHVVGGNLLAPVEAINMPHFYWDADPEAYYTLAITDPDVPSRSIHNIGQVRQLLIVNIIGNKVQSGDVYSSYLLPMPSPGSGSHRYVVLVYRQPGKLHIQEHRKFYSSPASRVLWSVAEFARKHRLGYPQFGNFFFSQCPKGTTPRSCLDT